MNPERDEAEDDGAVTAANRSLWTRALVGEMLPDAVSPLGWTLLWQPALVPGFRDLLVKRLGFDTDDIESGPLIRVYKGYVYINATLLRVLGRRVPILGAATMDQVVQMGEVPLPRFEREDWHQADSVAAAQIQQWSSWVLSSQKQTALAVDDRQSESIRRGRPDFDDLDDEELVAYAVALQPVCRHLFDQHLNQTIASLVGPPVIHEICTEVGQPAHTLRLMSGLGQVDSVAPTQVLWELSRLVRDSAVLTRVFDQKTDGVRRVLELSNHSDSVAMLAGLDAFMSEVGYRGPIEWDLSTPTWDVAPEIVVALVDCLRRCDDEASPRERGKHLESDRLRLAEEIGRVLNERDRRRLDQALAATHAFLRGRERSRTNLIRIIHEMRLPLRELAARGHRRGDFSNPGRLWMLTMEEVAYYADGGLAKVRSITDKRAAEFRSSVASEPPGLCERLDGQWAALEGAELAEDTSSVGRFRVGDVMLGIPGSPGMAHGVARVIESDSDLARVQPDEILILVNADLVAAPLFASAAAVVLDNGRTFSHAAVVARELGIPVVVGAKGASQKISTGDLVNVDGLTGVVSISAG